MPRDSFQEDVRNNSPATNLTNQLFRGLEFIIMSVFRVLNFLRNAIEYAHG